MTSADKPREGLRSGQTMPCESFKNAAPRSVLTLFFPSCVFLFGVLSLFSPFSVDKLFFSPVYMCVFGEKNILFSGLYVCDNVTIEGNTPWNFEKLYGLHCKTKNDSVGFHLLNAG